MMQVLDDVYHPRYQEDSVSESALAAYSEIAAALKQSFRPRNAMDVGCGGGALVRGLVDKGVDAWGIEGSSHGVALLPDRIELHDLRTPYPVRSLVYGGFDLVTCFDVGEHIEMECHETFADTIKTLMGNRGWLVFGAAGEGQDGLGHVSCAHPCHWIDLFQRRGFVLAPKLSEKVRSEIKEREGTNFLWWVAKNLMVFHFTGERNIDL